ncbi:MAG TPA: DedA family protein [Candidatus Moranbacteria bacterium]|nr:DedA family protein [Candidatus Moranbacteria bacterium]
MMEQLGQSAFQFLQSYGYAIMLPLMILEGPVATLAAAILASLGAFNVWIVLILSIIGDMVGDVILFGLGYHYGMGFVRRVGKYIGITEKLVLKMERYFERHGGKTIFAVKSTTGLCWAAFTAAGIVKMDFKKFIKYSIYGGIIWSGFLVFMGYFYGYLWREIRDYIKWVGWAITFLAVITFLTITVYKNRQAKKLLRENNQEHD